MVRDYCVLWVEPLLALPVAGSTRTLFGLDGVAEPDDGRDAQLSSPVRGRVARVALLERHDGSDHGALVGVGRWLVFVMVSDASPAVAAMVSVGVVRSADYCVDSEAGR